MKKQSDITKVKNVVARHEAYRRRLLSVVRDKREPPQEQRKRAAFVRLEVDGESDTLREDDTATKGWGR